MDRRVSAPIPPPNELLDDDDHFHDECGLFGVYGLERSSQSDLPGATRVTAPRPGKCGDRRRRQRRAQPAPRARPGRATSSPEPILATLIGDRAIGHVRYSTAGGSHLKNAQPIAVDYALGSLAVAHNGNLVNARSAPRPSSRGDGSIFQSTSDTEVLVHLIAQLAASAPRRRPRRPTRCAQVRGRLLAPVPHRATA